MIPDNQITTHTLADQASAEHRLIGYPPKFVSLLTARIDALEAALQEYANPRNWNANRNMWVSPNDPVFAAELVLRHGGAK